MKEAEPAPSDGEDRSILAREQPLPVRTIAYGSEPEQIADIYLPAGTPQGWAIAVHGGFWRPAYDRVHLRQTAAAVADAGSVSVLIEYRRNPGHPEQTVADVCRALRRLPELLSDTFSADLPVVWGHSAGGHLALLAACREGNNVHSVVALAPVTNLKQADSENLGKGAVREFLGAPAASHPEFDPAQQSPPQCPVTLIHGVRDSLVPISQSRALHRLWGETATCIELADTGHFEVIDPTSTAWTYVINALNANSAGPAGSADPAGSARKASSVASSACTSGGDITR